MNVRRFKRLNPRHATGCIGVALVLHWCCIDNHWWVFLCISSYSFDICLDFRHPSRQVPSHRPQQCHPRCCCGIATRWMATGQPWIWIWMDLDGSKKVSFSTHQALQALQILSGHNMVAVNAATWRPRIPKATCRHCKTLKTAPGVFSEAISAMEIHSRWEEAAV